MNKYCIISTAIDDENVEEKIIDELLRKRLVSSVQKKEIISSYWWNGKIEKNKEFLLQMKTKKLLYKEVEAEIQRLHTYEVPEIFSVDMEDGITCYLEWIEKETKNR